MSNTVTVLPIGAATTSVVTYSLDQTATPAPGDTVVVEHAGSPVFAVYLGVQGDLHVVELPRRESKSLRLWLRKDRILGVVRTEMSNGT